MIVFLLALLIIFWLMGYSPFVGGLSFPVFDLFGHTITMWDIFIFLAVAWAIGLLPSPFREIAGVLLILWILSVFGILAFFPGLSNILVVLIIIGLAFYLMGGGSWRNG